MCDSKRKDRLETKVKTRNRKNELKRKDGHDTQGTRKEPKVMNPKKETTGETWSESKALKRKRMIWQEKGVLGANNRVKMQEKIVRRWCRNIASLRYINSTNPFSMIWKIAQVWKKQFSDIENTLLEVHARWHSNATGSSHAPVRMLDATILAVHVQWHTSWMLRCSKLMCAGELHAALLEVQMLTCTGTLDATVSKLRCYGVWSSFALAHILDATLFGSHVLVGLMLRYLKCMCASALHATLLEVHVCRYTWWYGIWSSVAAAVAAPVCRSEGVTRMSR